MSVSDRHIRNALKGLAGVDPYKTPFLRLFLFYMRFLFPLWHLFFLMIFLVAVATAISVDSIFMPVVTRRMIDDVFPNKDWVLLWWIFGATILQITLHHLIWFILELIKYVIGMRIGMRIGMTAFRHLHSLSLRFIESKPVGEHIYRIGSFFDPQGAALAWIALIFDSYGTAASQEAPVISYDIDVVIGMVTQFVELVLRVTLQLLLIAGLVSLMIGPELGIALIFFAIPYLIGVHIMYNWQRVSEGRVRHLSQMYLAELQQSLAGIQTVKAYGKTRTHLLRYAHRFLWLCRRQGFYFLIRITTDNYINIAKFVFICGAYFYALAYQNVTLGTAVALYGMLFQFFNPINQAVRIIEGLRIQMVAARRLMETLGAANDVPPSDHPLPVGQAKGPVQLDGVHFRYLPDAPILRGVDINIESGKKTALVGPSGSGKSSLANLILRFYDPNKGTVQFDGKDLREIDLVEFYDRIGMVLQDDFLFSGTIRDNVIYGKRLATQAEVEEACRIAGIHDEIMEMPQQYDTMVGEGSGLSGGQIQRIALARAFVRKPNILVLDEATRALDARLHELVLNNIDETFQNSTRVVITHATNDTRNADHVIYLEDGLVKEQGTYDELVARNGSFAAMIDAEHGSGGEKED